MYENMVVLFNNMTGINILNGSWEGIIENHYEKFKCLYYLLKFINERDIELVATTEKSDFLNITIEFKSKRKLLSFIEKLNASLNESNFKKFNISHTYSHLNLDIDIRSTRESGDKYEDILCSY